MGKRPFRARCVCILGAYRSRRFENRDLSDYRCGAESGAHPHFKREKVLELIKRGKMEWVGSGEKIARYIKPMGWEFSVSKHHTTLQMKPGGPVNQASFLRGGLASPR